MVEAGRQADAEALLLEFALLQRCLAVSFGTLEHNLTYIIERVVETEHTPEMYVAIHRIACRARDVLLKSDTPTFEFACQLCGSLKGARIATARLETLLQSIFSFASSHLPLWLEPVWDVPTLEPPMSPLVTRLYGHTSNVSAIAVLPRLPPLVVSASVNGEVCVWDMSTYKCLLSAPQMVQSNGGYASVENILVAPDGLTFVLCCERKLFRFVNVESLAVLADYHVPQKEALSPGCGGQGLRSTLAECDGSPVLVIIGKKALFVVSMDKHELVKTLPLELHKGSGLGAAYCVDVARGPRPEEVIVCNSVSYIHLWDLTLGEPLFASYVLGLGGGFGPRTLWSGVKRTMVTWSQSGVVLWQLPEMAELTPPIHPPTGHVYRARVLYAPVKGTQVISVRGYKRMHLNPAPAGGDEFGIEFLSDELSERGVCVGETLVRFGTQRNLVDVTVQPETQTIHLTFQSGCVTKIAIVGDRVGEQLVYRRTNNAALPVLVMPPGNLLVSAEWRELIVLDPAHPPQTTHEKISVSAHQGNKIAVCNDQGEVIVVDAMSMRPLKVRTQLPPGRMVGDGIFFEATSADLMARKRTLIDVWAGYEVPVTCHVSAGRGAPDCTFRHRNGDVYAVFGDCLWRWSRAGFKQVLQKFPHSGIASDIAVLCQEQIAVCCYRDSIQVWLLTDGSPGDHSPTKKSSPPVLTPTESTSLAAPPVNLDTCSDRLSSMRLFTRRIASVGDDRCFVSASGNSSNTPEEIMVWHVEPEAGVTKLVSRMGDGFSQVALGLALSPDTRLIAVAFHEPATLQVWDRTTRELVACCPICAPAQSQTSAVVFLDNQHVVLACRMGALLYRIPK